MPSFVSSFLMVLMSKYFGKPSTMALLAGAWSPLGRLDEAPEGEGAEEGESALAAASASAAVRLTAVAASAAAAACAVRWMPLDIANAAESKSSERDGEGRAGERDEAGKCTWRRKRSC